MVGFELMPAPFNYNMEATLAWPEILIGKGPNWKKNCDIILVMFFGDVMVIDDVSKMTS